MSASRSAERVEGSAGIWPRRCSRTAQRTTDLSFSIGSAEAGNASTISSVRSSSRTIAAAASRSLDSKCLYSEALAMPTIAATSSTVIRS